MSHGTLHNLFQSTLSVRRATPDAAVGFHVHVISIHALREESDSLNAKNDVTITAFQSTLSVRRATIPQASRNRRQYHFNPRSP